jgi:hypothetical protein
MTSGSPAHAPGLGAALPRRTGRRRERAVRENLVRRLGEALIVLGVIVLALGLWIAGDSSSIARFVFRLAEITGLLFAGWGMLLRYHRHTAGCLAGAALAAVSAALLIALMIATGFETFWLPWLILDAISMAAALGLGARRWLRASGA